MNVILTECAYRQIKTIYELANIDKNVNFKVLLHNLSLCVKSLVEIKSIDEVPFGKRVHGKVKESGSIDGRLKKQVEYDLSDLASRDIDKSNRLVYFSYKDQSVIIFFIGHYGLSSDEAENYKNLDEEKRI